MTQDEDWRMLNRAYVKAWLLLNTTKAMKWRHEWYLYIRQEYIQKWGGKTGKMIIG